MGEIFHQLLIEASPSRVYEALTRPEGLASWWTQDVKAEAKLGSVAEFGFYGRSIVTKFRIERLEKGSQVKWRCVEGPSEYLDSAVQFDLRPTAQGTSIEFSHTKLGGSEDFLRHANESWVRVLSSLKAYVETGTGMPISD